MHDAVHAAASDAHAGSHGVDTVVEALHGHLGALARNAHHLMDYNLTVGNLGHLLLQQRFEEGGAGARDDDLGVVVVVGHALHDGTDGVALMIVVGGNLLALGKGELVVFVVYNENLAFPHLIDLAGDNLAHAVFILIIELVVLELQNLGSQSLTQVENGTAAEIGEFHGLGDFLAHLIVGFYLAGIGEADLRIVVLDIAVFHHSAVAIDFAVALVGIHNHREMVV